MENNQELILQCEAKAKQWLSPAFDKETRDAVQAMIDNEDKTEMLNDALENWKNYYDSVNN